MKRSVFLLISGLAIHVQAQIVTHKLTMHSADTQCFNENEFCFTDSIFPVSTRRVQKAVYLFSDGSKTERQNPGDTIMLCHSFGDPAGGTYSLVVEITDTTGQILKQTYQNIMTVLDCDLNISSGKVQSAVSLQTLSPGRWLLSGFDPGQLQAELYDLAGRRIPFRVETQGEAVVFSSESHAQGWYVLVLKDKQGRVQFRSPVR